MADDPTWNTTPGCAYPPADAIANAKWQIPRVLNGMDHNRSYPKLPSPNKTVPAADLIWRLKKWGHERDAAQWAIHELVKAGLLKVGGTWVAIPHVIDLSDPRPAPSPRRYSPDNFQGAVPFDKIVLQTTDGLWALLNTDHGDMPALKKDLNQRFVESSPPATLTELQADYDELRAHLARSDFSPLLRHASKVTRRLWKGMHKCGDGVPPLPAIPAERESGVLVDFMRGSPNGHAPALESALLDAVSTVGIWLSKTAEGTPQSSRREEALARLQRIASAGPSSLFPDMSGVEAVVAHAAGANCKDNTNEQPRGDKGKKKPGTRGPKGPTANEQARREKLAAGWKRFKESKSGSMKQFCGDQKPKITTMELKRILAILRKKRREMCAN